MDWLMVVLRAVHIVSGVIWAGGAIIGAWFIMPTVASLGPDGQKFMQRLVQNRFSAALSAVAVLTTLSGVWMYGRLSGWRSAWLSTGMGLFLTIGSIAGIIAFLIGLLLISRSSIRIAAIGREIQAAGGPPSAPLLAEMTSLRQRIARGGIWTAVLLLIATLGMATAQYIHL